MALDITGAVVAFTQWTVCGDCGKSFVLGSFHDCNTVTLQLPFCWACGRRHYLDSTGCTGVPYDFDQV